MQTHKHTNSQTHKHTMTKTHKHQIQTTKHTNNTTTTIKQVGYDIWMGLTRKSQLCFVIFLLYLHTVNITSSPLLLVNGR